MQAGKWTVTLQKSCPVCSERDLSRAPRCQAPTQPKIGFDSKSRWSTAAILIQIEFWTGLKDTVVHLYYKLDLFIRLN